ncbi:hypothetical protein [Ammoniphilus resinae]|uniref:Tissue inhibitor of metalloproteinase n=1 Tax=Ammoniphilus resinae TaxID=861532 RepID=A0ABS4GRK4_9BACL|nr:hypothetical protein [Ammoniphilus resinae]MBP1932757.1 hypothetical protein [Ammoniphilus resinae]
MIKNIQLVLVCCFVFSLMSVSIPSVGYACSCASKPAVQEELEKSAVVFGGKVIDIREKSQFNPKKTVLFEVSTAWKGGASTQMLITTGLGGGDCGFDFEKGKEYLVYANESSMYGGKDLVTTICDRTTELVSAQEDLTILGEGKVPTEKVNLEGKLGGLNPFVWILAIGVVGILVFLMLRRRRM